MKILSKHISSSLSPYFFSTVVVSYFMGFSGCDVAKGFSPTKIVTVTPRSSLTGWNAVKALYFLSGDRYLWVGADSQARVIDGSTNQVIREFSILPDDPKRCYPISTPLLKDGKTLIANIQISYPCVGEPQYTCYHQNIAGWNIETGQKLFERPELPETFHDVPHTISVSVDGSTMALPAQAVSSSISVVDVVTGQELFQISGPSEVKFLDNQSTDEESRYLPNNNRFLLGVGYGAHDEIWDLQTKSKLAEVPAHTYTTQPSISPDGTLLLLDTQELLWDLKQSKLAHTLSIPGEDVATLGGSFSSDGSRVMTFSKNHDPGRVNNARIHIWDTSSGQLLQTIDPPFNPRDQGSFLERAGFLSNHNNQIWTSAAGQYIRAWNIDSGSLLVTFLFYESFDFSTGRERLDPLHRPYFSPDGTQMMTTPNDSNQILIWDLSGL